MINYILADYKRVLGRIPRIVVLAIYEVIFIYSVMNSWIGSAGNFTSVNLLETAASFFGNAFMCLIVTIDFIQSFTYDFSCKTIQVAIGLGISRLNIVISKLIQTMLIILTDILITFGVLTVLSFITGAPLAAHQNKEILIKGFNIVLLASCSIALSMPLVFRTKSMILSMVSYFFLWTGLITYAIETLTARAPEFVLRLQLNRLTHDSCIGEILTDALIGRFRLMPCIGLALWFAIGIYLTWISFRKMELDF